MERTTNIAEAKQILGSHFVGPDELSLIADKTGIKVPIEIPIIPYDLKELKNKQKDYILILGSSQMENGEPLTLKSLRDHFGINPDVSEPCFYNQDWYLKEDFIEKPLESKWFLMRKNIFNETRGKNPDEIKNHCSLPSAILCAFSFFVYWFHTNECLWKHDFVWCNDLDANDDSIYVARYYDPVGISKNGFNIHRHLQIKSNYGAVELIQSLRDTSI
jgi:hypothetical protein